jgi:hypothetical protein
MGRGGGLVTVRTPHTCSPLSGPSFSFLYSAVEASFDIKRLEGSRTLYKAKNPEPKMDENLTWIVNLIYDFFRFLAV